MLLRKIAPGTYRRGGSVHLRIWVAERLIEASGAANLSGATWMVHFARALGAKIGRRVDLHTLPPVTGMIKLGEGCSIEPETDLSGYWIDGDVIRDARGSSARLDPLAGQPHRTGARTPPMTLCGGPFA